MQPPLRRNSLVITNKSKEPSTPGLGFALLRDLRGSSFATFAVKGSCHKEKRKPLCTPRSGFALLCDLCGSSFATLALKGFVTIGKNDPHIPQGSINDYRFTVRQRSSV